MPTNPAQNNLPPPPPPPPLPSGRQKVKAKNAGNDPGSGGQKVSVKPPNDKAIPVPQAQAQAQAQAQGQKILGERNIGPMTIEPEQPLPTVQADSTNLAGVPDGTLFIEAGDDAEASADELVDNIEGKHGKKAADKAKKFFKSVLKKIKDNKNTILTVAGFALIVGGVAGGIAFPAVLIVAAPGIIMVGCGMIGMMDDILLRQTPKEQKTDSDDPRLPSEENKNKKEEEKKTKEGEEKKTNSSKSDSTTAGTQTTEAETGVTSGQEPPASRKKEDDKDDEHKKLSSTVTDQVIQGTQQTTTVQNSAFAEAGSMESAISHTKPRESSSEIRVEPPFVPPGPKDTGYEAWLETSELRKSLETQGPTTMNLLSVDTGSAARNEAIRFLNKGNKLQQGSRLEARDFAAFDIEEELEKLGTGLTEKQRKEFYAVYSQLAVGYDLFLWTKGNKKKEVETGGKKNTVKVYPAINQIKPGELLALRNSVKREELKLVVEAIKNEEKLDAARIARQAVKNLEEFTARLTPPPGRTQEKQEREATFVEGVNTFLSDYVRSFKLKTD